MDGKVPIIDMSGNDDKVAAELHSAFRNVGFACLAGTELYEQAEAYAKFSQDFFTQERKEKAKYTRPMDNCGGWLCVGRERLISPDCSQNPERSVGDYKECYNILPTVTDAKPLPDAMHPVEAWELWDAFEKLAKRVFRLMAIGLKLSDHEFIASTHTFKSKKNRSTMRVNYYPRVEKERIVNHEQVRCGEHSDYGSITLLYTGSPGLEVVNRQTGEYEAAQFVPGGIYVNLGDMMQRWTADILIANLHRVMIPSDEKMAAKARISIPFFCQPDDDAMIECLDGSGKYPPVLSGEWLSSRCKDTYNYPPAEDVAQMEA